VHMVVLQVFVVTMSLLVRWSLSYSLSKPTSLGTVANLLLLPWKLTGPCVFPAWLQGFIFRVLQAACPPLLQFGAQRSYTIRAVAAELAVSPVACAWKSVQPSLTWLWVSRDSLPGPRAVSGFFEVVGCHGDIGLLLRQALASVPSTELPYPYTGAVGQRVPSSRC
jgi:hypothetical protein